MGKRGLGSNNDNNNSDRVHKDQWQGAFGLSISKSIDVLLLYNAVLPRGSYSYL